MSDSAPFGNLKASEVERLKATNAAFFQHYVEIRPAQEQLQRLRQRQAARNAAASASASAAGGSSTGNNKERGEKRPSMDTTTSQESGSASSSSSSSSSSSGAVAVRAVPLKKRRVSLDHDMKATGTSHAINSNNKNKLLPNKKKKNDTAATTAAKATASRRVTMETTKSTDTLAPLATTETAPLLAKIPPVDTRQWDVHPTTGQFIDRNNLEQLQAVVDLNPVLGYIQERGGKAPKRVLFPDDATCEYFYEYLACFPQGTWALPQVFCRLIKGLNSNHWLALAAMRFRDRRQAGQGQFGSLRPEEVQRLKKVNLAFYCHYVCQKAPNSAVAAPNSSAEISSSAAVNKQREAAREEKEEDKVMADETTTEALEDDEEDQGEEELDDQQDASESSKMAAGMTAPAAAATMPSGLPTMQPPSLATHDPIRQLLQEHLLRSSLLSQAAPQPSPLLSLAGAGGSSLYQELLARVALGGGLPHRDLLPLLAANLSSSTQVPAGSPSAAAASPNDAFSTLTSLLQPSPPPTAPNTGAAASSQPSYVVGTSMQMAPPHSVTNLVNYHHHARASLPAQGRPTYKKTVVDLQDEEEDESMDAQASEEPAAPKGRGGDWSMLDILAATASAARLQVD